MKQIFVILCCLGILSGTEKTAVNAASALDDGIELSNFFIAPIAQVFHSKISTSLPSTLPISFKYTIEEKDFSSESKKSKKIIIVFINNHKIN